MNAISAINQPIIWWNYLHDFFYIKLKLHINDSDFSHDLMLAILEHGTESKLTFPRELPDNDKLTVSHLLVSLHFQFHVNRKFLKSHSTVLNLLNKVDIKSDCSFKKALLHASGSNPIELMHNSSMLCFHVLDTLYKFLCHPANGYTADNLMVWNSMYHIMVSIRLLMAQHYQDLIFICLFIFLADQ